MILSPHEIAWLVVRRFDGRGLRLRMVAISLAESGGDCEALGRSTTGANVGQRDHGLTQISGRWCGEMLQRYAAAGRDWRDPRANMDMARDVFDARLAAASQAGVQADPLDAWNTYVSGSWRRFIPDARHGLAAPFPPPIYRPAGLSAGATFRLEEGTAHG